MVEARYQKGDIHDDDAFISRLTLPLVLLVVIPIAVLAPIAFSYEMPSKADDERGIVGTMAFLAAAGPALFIAVWYYLESTQQHKGGKGIQEASSFAPLPSYEESLPHAGAPGMQLVLAPGAPGYGMEDPWGRPTGPRVFNPMMKSYPSMPSGVWRGWYWQYGYTHNVTTH